MLRSARKDLLIVAALYVASTVLYALLGVRFDASAFDTGMQFIDRQLLLQRLLESLWYYHATPPALNFIAGTGLKLFGEQAITFYSVLFHAVGLLTTLCVYTLTARSSGSRIAALITAGLLAFSPAFVLYQNLFFYTFLAMALLVFAALALYRYQETTRTGWCVIFFALLATLLLTRSLYHLVWMVVIAAGLAAINWQHRKQILVAASLPFVVVLTWYGKNYYYFGTFGASTWMGLGLYNITTLITPRPLITPLVENGTLTPWALRSRYAPRPLMFEANLTKPIGVPVVDNVAKASHTLNMNFRDIPVVNRFYTHDAFTIARHYPATYVYGMILANRMYFTPTSVHQFFTPENHAAVRPMEAIFTPLLSGVPMRDGELVLDPRKFPDPLRVNTSILLIGVWFALIGFAYVQARRAFLNPARRRDPRAVVLAFIAITGVYAYVLSTTIELGENNRYRFEVEPLFLVVAATAILAIAQTVSARAALILAPRS